MTDSDSVYSDVSVRSSTFAGPSADCSLVFNDNFDLISNRYLFGNQFVSVPIDFKDIRFGKLFLNKSFNFVF